MESIELLNTAIYEAPLSLLSLRGASNIDYVNSFLPYSTGFELEIKQKEDSFKLENFENIPDILHVDIDRSEQRFRIPNGIAGFVCLYNICVQLRKNNYLNEESAIHYHIDMTDCYRDMDDKFIERNNNWVIDEVKTWGDDFADERGSCSRSRGWVRYADEHKTLEIRLGEPTFDYRVMVKRIIHANQIVAKLKCFIYGELSKPVPTINFYELDNQKVIEYCISQVLNDKDESVEEDEKEHSQEFLKSIINSRVIKFKK